MTWASSSFCVTLFSPPPRPPERARTSTVYGQSDNRANSGEPLRKCTVAKVGGSDKICHHVYDPAGAASTIRTDGDRPGLATSLYWFYRICRRLSWREAARTHSIPKSTIHEMEQFVTSTTTNESQQEKELLRFIGNSTPVMTLHDVVQHLLSLPNW